MLVNFYKKKSISKSSPKNYLCSSKTELIWDLAIGQNIDGNMEDSL
jgi:hypothetical protein